VTLCAPNPMSPDAPVAGWCTACPHNSLAHDQRGVCGICAAALAP
jgi:hypothetical protein